MASHDSSSKFEISIHTLLPLMLMLLIQMIVHYLASPSHSIFVSPYLLAYFTAGIIAFIVLWKGQICPGQRGRLTFIFPLFVFFALGNLAYTIMFTPKHTPLMIVNCAALIFPFIYWRLTHSEIEENPLIYCGLAIIGIGVIQYLLVYWVELPSLLTWLRANNFAQFLFGLLLAGWYLVLAKSRLEAFLKLLVKLALVTLVLSYVWTILMLYSHLQVMAVSLLPYMIFFVIQFLILAMLGWLLLGKNIKNPVAWTIATFSAMLYPLINVV